MFENTKVNMFIDLLTSQLLHWTQSPRKTLAPPPMWAVDEWIKSPTPVWLSQVPSQLKQKQWGLSCPGQGRAEDKPHVRDSTICTEKSMKGCSWKEGEFGAALSGPQTKQCIYSLLHMEISFCRHLSDFSKLKLGARFIGGTWNYQLCWWLG